MMMVMIIRVRLKWLDLAQIIKVAPAVRVVRGVISARSLLCSWEKGGIMSLQLLSDKLVRSKRKTKFF